MYDIYFDLDNMHPVVDDDDSCFMMDDRFDFDFLADIAEEKTKKSKSNGCTCLKCGEIYPYAEPNQLDGSFKCYSCRKYG
jgi:formylmethanofuran dehydrogenase subunit E